MGAEGDLDDSEALLRAAASGSSKEVASLLSTGLPPDVRDGEGNTPLILAAWANHDKVVKLLLGAGADVTAINSAGHDALSLAASIGHESVVRILLSEGRFHRGIGHAATRALGRFEPFEYSVIGEDTWWEFVEHEPGEKRPSPAKLRKAWQSLYRCVELLLNAGANPNVAIHRGMPLLNGLACHAECVEIMRLLLDHGASPNLFGSDGCSALATAIVGNNTQGALLLLERGADPNSGWKDSPLMLAASRSGTLVRALLAAGVEVDASDD